METEIDKLNTELAIGQSKLEHFKLSSKSTELVENRVQKDCNSDNSSISILRERLNEFEIINSKLNQEKAELEKIKIKLELKQDHSNNNINELKKKLDKKDENCIELKAQLRAQELMFGKSKESTTDNKSYNDLIVESRRQINNIRIFECEMNKGVQEICVQLSADVLKRFSNIKSISDSIVNELDKRYGRKWHCFLGNSFEHSTLMHEFGTYLSFTINELRIIIYKSNENVIFQNCL